MKRHDSILYARKEALSELPDHYTDAEVIIAEHAIDTFIDKLENDIINEGTSR